MRQKKYLEIGHCIKEYKEAKTIELKRIKFLQCTQAINNLKDWILNNEDIQNKEQVKKALSQNVFYKIINTIANTDKHYKLKNGWYKLEDFIETKTTNSCILEKHKKQINEDFVTTKDSSIKEYQYLEIRPQIGAYELLNNCLKEIHKIINDL